LAIDRELKSDAAMEKEVDLIRRNTLVMELSGDSFQIGYSSTDPVHAKNMVEAITRLFIDKSLAASRREAMSAVTFLEKEVEHYQEELKRVNQELQDFRIANRELLSSPSVPGALDLLRDKIAETENGQLDAQLFMQLFRDRLSGVKPMVSSSPLHVQNSPYQAHFQELQLQMGNLLATRTETHPEVLKKQRELDHILTLLKKEKEEKEKEAKESTEMRSPMYLETLARLDDTQIKAKTLELRSRELQRRQEELLQNLARTPIIVQEERRLDNECRLTREIYDKLSMKLEEARVTCAVEIEQQASRFSIVEPARVPLKHYKPKRKLFAVAGVAGGILLGLTLVFLLEITDPRLVRPGELARSTGLPLLGTLPKLHTGTRLPGWYIPGGVQALYSKMCARLQGSARPWVSRFGHWLPDACEAVDQLLHLGLGAKRFELPLTMPANRVLPAARLQHAGRSRNRKELALDDFIERIRHIGIALRASFQAPDRLVCLVASARHGEGRTLLTANLGVVLASDLKKPVLLVDACLENAGLSALFQRAEAPGLGDVLDGRATLDSVLVDSGTPNLWLLPAGHTHEYADVLFNGTACRQLLEQLRERFSMVLIETQNLSMQSDALLLAPHTDGVLMLSRMYDTKKKVVESLLQQLPPEKIIGLVTNYSEYWIPEWLYRWV
ncbi:MAG: GNVR domain-containing protein, partial [bacterium]